MRPATLKNAAADLESAAAGHTRTGAKGTRQLTPRAWAGLAVLAGLSAMWVASLDLPMPGDVVASGFRSAPTYPQARQAITGLRLAALDRAVPLFESRRNIFAFASLPADPQTRGFGDHVQQGGGRQQTRKKAQPAADPAPGVDFLGVFGPRRLAIGVVKGKGDDGVTNLLEHDVVEGRFRVLEIDPKSILFRDLASPDAPPIRVKHPGAS